MLISIVKILNNIVFAHEAVNECPINLSQMGIVCWQCNYIPLSAYISINVIWLCVQDTALNTVKILQYYGFMVFQLSLRCQLSLVNMSPDHSIVIKILQIKQVSTALLFMCVLLHQQYWSLTVNMVLNSYFGIYRMMVVGWDDMLWTYWLFLTRQNDKNNEKKW